MRIATLINSLNAGGAEAALYNLVAATHRQIEHVVVPLIDGGALTHKFRSLDVEIVECGFARSALSVTAVPGLLSRVAKLQPEILVGWMYHSAVLATLARPFLRARVPLIWSIHHSADRLAEEAISTRAAIGLCRMLSDRPDAIVFVSGRAAQQHAALGISQGRSVVIPNGYDLDTYKPDPAARKRLRMDWGFDGDDVVVGHVARVHPTKDHGNFIEALVRAVGREPDLKAIFCGEGTDALAIPPSLRDRVRLLGYRTDIPAVMNACDVGCLSSAGEAFPNVLAEFLACGRPCVTTDVGDAAVIVEDFGSIVPPRDPAALADALVKLARATEAERAALGAGGRRSVLARFETRAIAARHAELWQRLVQEER